MIASLTMKKIIKIRNKPLTLIVLLTLGLSQILISAHIAVHSDHFSKTANYIHNDTHDNEHRDNSGYYCNECLLSKNLSNFIISNEITNFTLSHYYNNNVPYITHIYSNITEIIYLPRAPPSFFI